MPGRILLSPVGGQVMYGVVKYFKEKRVEVIGIDNNPESIGKYIVDKFFKVPSVNCKTYKNAVLKIISETRPDIFISWLDPEIIFWNEQFISGKIPQKLADIHTFNFRSDLMNFYDKYKFYSCLVESRLYFPKTYLLSEHKNIKDLSFPAIIKPRIGTGAKNVFVVEKRGYLRHYLTVIKDRFTDVDNFLIQEYIPGQEYTVDFFASQGEIVNLVIRKRMEHSGVSLRGEITYNKEVERAVIKFTSQFKIDGINNIQLIESKKEIFIIDFNPRPSGTIVFSIKAGVDFIENMIEKKENKKITSYGKPKKIKMIRCLHELYYE